MLATILSRRLRKGFYGSLGGSPATTRVLRWLLLPPPPPPQQQPPLRGRGPGLVVVGSSGGGGGSGGSSSGGGPTTTPATTRATTTSTSAPSLLAATTGTPPPGSRRPPLEEEDVPAEGEGGADRGGSELEGGVRLSRLLSSSLLGPLLLSSTAPSSNRAAMPPRSRREAERMIRGGFVSINGRVVTKPQRVLGPADFVVGEAATGADSNHPTLTVAVRGTTYTLVERGFRALATAETATTTLAPSPSPSSSSSSLPRVWIAHKRAGELVTERDPHDRPSLLERLRRGGVGRARRGSRGRVDLKAVGRLDMSTEGLILLTDDGRYARDMELPDNQLHRTYRVRVHGSTDLDRVRRALGRGITVDGVRYAPMTIRLDPTARFANTNRWIQVTCTQGKNRQIRRVFSHFGLNVTRLIRVSYGDYQLDTIPPGLAIEVPHKPVAAQRRRGHLLRGSSSSSSLHRRSSTSTTRPFGTSTGLGPTHHVRSLFLFFMLLLVDGSMLSDAYLFGPYPRRPASPRRRAASIPIASRRNRLVDGTWGPRPQRQPECPTWLPPSGTLSARSGASPETELVVDDDDDDEDEWVPDRIKARQMRFVSSSSSRAQLQESRAHDRAVSQGEDLSKREDVSPYTDEEENVIARMGGKSTTTPRRREEGYLGDSTLREIAQDYSIPICYLADVLCGWGVPAPIDVHDRLGDLVTGEQAFSLLEAVNSLDVAAVQDRYSNQNLLILCEEWGIDLPAAFEHCMKEGWSLPFGVQTCLRVEQEEELLRVYGSAY